MTTVIKGDELRLGPSVQAEIAMNRTIFTAWKSSKHSQSYYQITAMIAIIIQLINNYLTQQILINNPQTPKSYC